MKSSEKIYGKYKKETQVPDRGHPEFFKKMYARYREAVFRKCLSILKDRVDAEDAVQEVFTRIYLHLPQFRREARFSTWLYAITYNYCVEYRRKQQKQRKLSLRTDRLPDRPNAAEDGQLLREKERELKLVLNELPEADNRILKMKFLDQMSIKSIAGKLRTSEGAIKMRIHRAKAKAQRLRWQLAGCQR